MYSQSSSALKEADSALIRDLANVAKAVKKAIGERPVKDDPKFAAVRKATVGTPLVVRSKDGKDAYWLVPLLMADKTCGFAQVEKNMKVSIVGSFGANSEDRGSWVDASFFERPPLEVVNTIKARYPEMEMSEPFFSYDKSPAKWGWMVRLKDGRRITVFINPAGWYEQTERDGTIEG